MRRPPPLTTIAARAGDTPPAGAAPRSSSSPGPQPTDLTAIAVTGSNAHPQLAAGDHRSETSVGANFYSAAELAELALPGLPRQRHHISRLATKLRWEHRQRVGRGGGREFPLSALPAEARGEILKRRQLQNAAEQLGTSRRRHAPLVTLADLKARQAERLTAREAVLQAFDAFKGAGSDRAALDAFIAAWREGHVALPSWAAPMVKKLSRRTLERWLAARNAGDDLQLAGKWKGGRRSVFDQSPELAEFVLGVHTRQPMLKMEELAGLVRQKFPQGTADASGLLLPCPSEPTIARFLKAWKGEALNAQILAAATDPDRYRSKFRFALGDASAGIVRPNQRWMIDASPADVLCSDGRHSIYVLIDCFSRRLLALVSKTPRTVASLLLVARGCQVWGVPEELWTDNGSDFSSKHFVLAMRQLGVHHHLTPPFSPEKKPFVERAIKTIQHKFMPLMEGFAGHSVADRSRIEQRHAFAARLGEEEKKLLGATTYSGDLQDALSAWIANRYEHRAHAGLDGRTPIEAWEQGTRHAEVRFAHPAALGPLLMPPASDEGARTVTRKGVSVGSIDYFCEEMIVGQRVQVRLDPDDLGRVWIYTDTDPWRFIGIARNIELEGIDRAEAAMRQRALQAETVKAGKAEIRRMMRAADVSAMARLYIGDAPPAAAANVNITHTTPALEEAVRAARITSQGKRRQRHLEVVSNEERAAHEAFVENFDEPDAREETGAERYARWKALRLSADRGEAIPAELADWFTHYPDTGEWRAHRLVEEDREAG